jgi:hypothetical protein
MGTSLESLINPTFPESSLPKQADNASHEFIV